MERPQFEALVRDMEALNKRDPSAYRKHVARYAVLGTVAFILLLILMIALGIGLIWSMFWLRRGNYYLLAGGIGCLLAAFGMIRAVFANSKTPNGVEVTPDVASELFAKFESARQKIGAPPIHKVLVDEQFNAFASSSYKFLGFGEKCHVVLGMPLMLCCDPDELMSVVGHELGHHAHGDVRQGMTMYRLYHMWERTAEAVAARAGLMSVLVNAFLKWYVPRFSAVSFVLRRQAEFDADRIGAEVTSTDATTRTDLRLAVMGESRVGPAMKEVYKRALARKAMPTDVMSQFSRVVRELTPENPEKALRTALLRETVYEDSHPSPRERIAALGHPLEPDDPNLAKIASERAEFPSPTAATHFFGSNLPEMLQRVDRYMAENHKEGWERAIAERKVFETEMEQPYDENNLEQVLDRVRIVTELQGSMHAGPFVHRAMELAPDKGIVQYYHAWYLAETDDPEAEAALRKVADNFPEYREGALETLAGLLHSEGRSVEAREASIASSEAADESSKYWQELYSFSSSHAFEAFEVEPAITDELRAAFAAKENVIEAYWFRRRHNEKPDLMLEVLAVFMSKPTFALDEDRMIRDLRVQVDDLVEPIVAGRYSVYVDIIKKPVHRKVRELLKPFYEKPA